MTNPTNPFNWQMPTASDLVTDLPADFEVFGQAVATSMADLLGGTTGQVLSMTLQVDSSTATGLKWAAPTAPTLAGVRAVKSALQSISSGTYTSVAFDAADTYDTNSFHNPSTNNTRITIPTGGTGYYQIFGMITWVPASNHLGVMNFYKNGSSIMSFNIIATGNSSYQQAQFMTDVQYLTAGDYIEIQVYQNLGSAINVQGNTSDAQSSFFGVNFLGA
jgi:hypothetical protein